MNGIIIRLVSNNADGNCGRGKIYWGDDQGKFDEKENL